MALDFCIKNDHGVVQHTIALGPHEFYEILEIAATSNPSLPLIGRLKDYYKDEEFYILELPELKNEMLEVYKKSNEKLKILQKLALLCDLALLYNTTICVLAD
jgi:hypothetical protein